MGIALGGLLGGGTAGRWRHEALEAVGVIDCLGDPNTFFPESPALGERTHLGRLQANQPRDHGRQDEVTEALTRHSPCRKVTFCL